MNQQLDQLYQLINQCYLYDRYPLKRELHKLSRKLKQQSGQFSDSLIAQLEGCEHKVKQSIEKVLQRRQNVPNIDFADALPVAQKMQVIQEAIKDHQVIIIAGETGSGKTTQIPKMALSVILDHVYLTGMTRDEIQRLLELQPLTLSSYS